MPGITIKVKWPTGNIVVNHEDPRWIDIGGAVWVDLGYSSDPNDHYRWYLEKNIGYQGWDWDWKLSDDNHNITIKVRKKHKKFATLMGLMWS